eukprot:2678436-Karenia_brevis.AAC.1
MEHIIWKCGHPSLKQARNNNNTPQQQHILDHINIIPNYILLGIPQSMSSQFTQPWWQPPSTAFDSSTA